MTEDRVMGKMAMGKMAMGKMMITAPDRPAVISALLSPQDSSDVAPDAQALLENGGCH